MKSSNNAIVCVLEICTTKDHFYRMGYRDREKAQTASNGFLRAMREASPDSVCCLWEKGTMTTIDGVAETQVPAFAVRVGEIGSVLLRDVSQHTYGRDDEEEQESWRS